jgi:hypothetical protein
VFLSTLFFSKITGIRGPYAGVLVDNVPSMEAVSTVHQFEKISRIWSDRRESRIAVRIRYDVYEERGCKIYTLYPPQEWREAA